MSDLPATVFVLYGATGDLAKRMVLPAFFDLYARGLLPRRWKLVGNGRGDVAHEDFRGHVHDVLTEFGTVPTDEQWAGFAPDLLFAGGGFRAEDGGQLPDLIEQTRAELGADAQLIHYLAVPPSAFAPTTEALREHDLAKGTKVVFEKPYGTSLESLHELDALVHTVFDEEQVFRIDHFLGKEATQNVHMLRFANTMVSRVWDRSSIEEVQIDVPETLDIADRAAFYDATGASLDMLVTHLFQVAAEVAMEPPTSFAPEDMQLARESVISAFRPLDPADVVLGQFDGYRQTEGIADDSSTDTYVAAKLWVDTDRWRDVPFVLRTGKRLQGGAQRLSLLFRTPEGPLHSAGKVPEVLAFDLEGSGRILMELTVKAPGPDFVPSEVDHVLRLDQVADGSMAPYTSLIYDVLRGDRSLFTSSIGLAAAFTAFAPLLGPERPDVVSYPEGSWGPAAADRLTGRFGWLLARE
ncbi:glucose-6-phosphate dehydrogenase [Microlunatus aurantiacus]|uniref:Glucose-6-phosphate 1-dehydrogenase n=1 Tax=Microlunatus aurantiacus TaxID=446786 RepID=A0ABP7DIT3_9ACTN